MNKSFPAEGSGLSASLLLCAPREMGDQWGSVSKKGTLLVPSAFPSSLLNPNPLASTPVHLLGPGCAALHCHERALAHSQENSPGPDPAPPRPMGSPAPGKPIPELSVPPAGPTAEGLVWGRHAHWTSLGTHTIFHLLLSPAWPTYRKGWDAHPSPPGLGA